MSAAPLKPERVGDEVGQQAGLPRSDERGPIEAGPLVLRWFPSPRSHFRAQMSAAPLKRLSRSALIAAPLDFRAQMSAAPLKRSQTAARVRRNHGRSKLRPYTRAQMSAAPLKPGAGPAAPRHALQQHAMPRVNAACGSVQWATHASPLPPIGACRPVMLQGVPWSRPAPTTHWGEVRRDAAQDAMAAR